MENSFFVSCANELGEIVMKERTPKAARQYLGWIRHLGPSIYKPSTEVFETALDLAILDMENAGLPPNERVVNYRFLGELAARYGFDRHSQGLVEKIYHHQSYMGT